MSLLFKILLIASKCLSGCRASIPALENGGLVRTWVSSLAHCNGTRVTLETGEQSSLGICGRPIVQRAGAGRSAWASCGRRYRSWRSSVRGQAKVHALKVGREETGWASQLRLSRPGTVQVLSGVAQASNWEARSFYNTPATVPARCEAGQRKSRCCFLIAGGVQYLHRHPAVFRTCTVTSQVEAKPERIVTRFSLRGLVSVVIHIHFTCVSHLQVIYNWEVRVYMPKTKEIFQMS